ncbi:MAG: KGK domain-containing protein [Snowella sp.]|nr:KGK domain-containing protein [Snowella sp.]
MDQRQLVNNNDVISVAETDKALISHRTFKVDEFLTAIFTKLFNNDVGKKWCFDGVECEVLSPGKSWQKGKIKISLEFIADEPESPLDDIRREMQDQ